MLKVINYLNKKWNQYVCWFHDASVKINVRWLVVLSIWAYNHLTWQLSDDWQLINGITLREYKLKRELELAYHQIQYYADYANELQWQILEQMQEEEKKEEKEELNYYSQSYLVSQFNQI